MRVEKEKDIELVLQEQSQQMVVPDYPAILLLGRTRERQSYVLVEVDLVALPFFAGAIAAIETSDVL